MLTARKTAVAEFFNSIGTSRMSAALPLRAGTPAVPEV
jgi:hypothetical protein